MTALELNALFSTHCCLHISLLIQDGPENENKAAGQQGWKKCGIRDPDPRKFCFLAERFEEITIIFSRKTKLSPDMLSDVSGGTFLIVRERNRIIKSSAENPGYQKGLHFFHPCWSVS